MNEKELRRSEAFLAEAQRLSVPAVFRGGWKQTKSRGQRSFIAFLSLTGMYL